MKSWITLAAVLPLALAGALPAPARAETFHACAGFVTSVPATITSQGVWCFDRDLASALASGTLITIATNNVTLDCNGFKLGGIAAGDATTTVGIRIGAGRANATVRNCNVRGFAVGIAMDGYDGVGHRIENNRLDTNRAIGIDARGTALTIRGNVVVDTGGSTVYSGRHGIYVTGDADVVDNVVDGVISKPGSWSMGLVMYGALHSTVRGNRVRNMVSDLPANGIQVSGYVLVEDNFVASATHAGSWAIHCSGALGTAAGNRTLGYGTGILECRDGGGNLVLD